jgi:hypothetical protein
MDDISAFLILIFIQYILVTSCNGICNFKSLCKQIYDYKSFLSCATKDNHKNGQFGHKSQMNGLEWTKLLVVMVSLAIVTTKIPS